MKLTEHDDGIMSGQACQVPGKLRSGTKKSGLTQSDVLLTNPEKEYCEDQHGSFLFIRAVQGHSHVVVINPNPMFSGTGTVVLEGTHIPHGQLFQL